MGAAGGGEGGGAGSSRVGHPGTAGPVAVDIPRAVAQGAREPREVHGAKIRVQGADCVSASGHVDIRADGLCERAYLHRPSSRAGPVAGNIECRTVHHRQVGYRAHIDWGRRTGRAEDRAEELARATSDRSDICVAGRERPARQVVTVEVQTASRMRERPRAAQGERISQLYRGSRSVYGDREIEGDAVAGDDLYAGGRCEGGGLGA